MKAIPPVSIVGASERLPATNAPAPPVEAVQPSSQSVSALRHAALLQRIRQSQVASAEHKTLFNDLTKSDITSVKVLGEGAFGLVDLVLVDVFASAAVSGNDAVAGDEGRKSVTTATVGLGPAGGTNGWIADGALSPRRVMVGAAPVAAGEPTGLSLPPPEALTATARSSDAGEAVGTSRQNSCLRPVLRPSDLALGPLASTSGRHERSSAADSDRKANYARADSRSLDGDRRGVDARSLSRSLDGERRPLDARSNSRSLDGDRRLDLTSNSIRRNLAVEQVGGRGGHEAGTAAGTHVMQLLCVRKKLLKQGGKNLQDPENEAALLERCAGCNFVVQLWSHGVGLYDHTLLMEYCPYGSLEKLLQVVGLERKHTGCSSCLTDFLKVEKKAVGLSEAESVFLAACLLEGLEQLHGVGIVHRDLKPANCLMASNGYLRLADLGLAKDVSRGGKAYTKVGTPCFMAPEVVHAADKNVGYSYPCDLWAVGLIIWNMVGGALPKWSAMSWYWSTLHFPQSFSPALCELLTGLLEKNPKDRLSLAGAKASRWLATIDWSALGNEQLVPPSIPELEDLKLEFVKEKTNSGFTTTLAK